MPRLQDIIYRLEQGSGVGLLSKLIVGLALLGLVLAYNLRGYQNMSNQEAMDMAQLARNLAQGRGYTTLFIRPFSLYLMGQHSTNVMTAGQLAAEQDPGLLDTPHPDLANPPVYPLVLAGLMKVLPFRFEMSSAQFWSPQGNFLRYQPDFLISLFNQLLFLGVVVLTFLLARRLFDRTVAWVSAGVLLGADAYWRFAVSGLSTMLLLCIAMLLAWVLVFLENAAREEGKGRFWVLAGLAGLLVGVGALTRYSFVWVIVPVVVYIGLIGPGMRRWAGVLSLVICLGVMAPWVVRNYAVSGTPFGVAGYAPMEDTSLFPEQRLQRSLRPSFASRLRQSALWAKGTGNARRLLEQELPTLGGSWIGAFFVVGLLIRYRSPGIRRLRHFLLLAIATMAVTQVFIRTQISDDSPVINSENLLILFGPLILVYGVSLFLLLLDQLVLPGPQVRYLILGLFLVLACAPILFTLFGAPRSPIAYPPYNPVFIRFFASKYTDQELTMSDIPWAVAWYGQKLSVWLTLKPYTLKPNPKERPPVDTEVTPITVEEPLVEHEDIASIRDDYNEVVMGLLLSPVTTQGGVLGKEETWANVVVLSYDYKTPKELTAIEYVAKLRSRDHVILSDRNRWEDNILRRPKPVTTRPK